jgi:hypothetical protein
VGRVVPEPGHPLLQHPPLEHADILKFEGGTIGLAVFESGWKWSKDVQPLVGTQSCQAPHFCYYVSGRMAVVMDDGTRAEMEPGDVAFIPPGHDAWVIGDEPCVMLDFEGMQTYAQAREPARPQAEVEPLPPAVH